MTRMTLKEKQQFLAGVHVGVLALTRPDAGPLAVPLWYDYRPGGELWFVTVRNSRKAGLLAPGTRISLCAQSETPPYQYVSVEGPVTSMEPLQDELLPMAVRYLGEEAGRAFVESSPEAHEDSVVVRMTPERWLAVDYSRMG